MNIEYEHDMNMRTGIRYSYVFDRLAAMGERFGTDEIADRE